MGKHDRSYGSLITLVFVRNIDKGSCSSIKQLIDIADKLGEKIGYKTNIGYDTKLSIVNDMIERGVLVKGERGLTQPILLNSRIRDYLLDALSKIHITRD